MKNIFLFLLSIVILFFFATFSSFVLGQNNFNTKKEHSYNHINISLNNRIKEDIDFIPYTILISFDGLRYDFEDIFARLQKDSVQISEDKQEILNNTDSLKTLNDSNKIYQMDTVLPFLNDSMTYKSKVVELRNFKFIEENGVKAFSLKPVFPTTTLPNHYSVLSGMYPENHGILANSFKDPFTHNYFASNSKGSRKLSKWYIAENFWETAKRQGIKTGACYWTCPKLDDDLKNPDYLIEFDGETSYFDRIDEGFEWLEKDFSERPRFITFYFEEADIKAHLFGTKSYEMSSALLLVDSIVGYFLEKLRENNLYDSTNIIVISDHGTLDFVQNNFIFIDEILAGIRYELQNYGAFMMLDGNENVLNEIYDSLKKHAENYKVFFREEIPSDMNFSKHPFISPILILASPGWILVDENSLEKSKHIKAVHGYVHNEISMHGIFYAMGPSFKKNCKVDTLQNIDIYPLLCKIFNIMPRNNIDGKLERIEKILKDRR